MINTAFSLARSDDTVLHVIVSVSVTAHKVNSAHSIFVCLCFADSLMQRYRKCTCVAAVTVKMQKVSVYETTCAKMLTELSCIFLFFTGFSFHLLLTCMFLQNNIPLNNL